MMKRYAMSSRKGKPIYLKTWNSDKTFAGLWYIYMLLKKKIVAVGSSGKKKLGK